MNIGPVNSNNLDDLNLPARPMATGKTKSWLGEYHWVSVASDSEADSDINKVVEWCKEYFGKSGSRWFEQNRKFYFRDEKDMSMFILRWS